MDDLAYGVIFLLVVFILIGMGRTSENRPQGGGTKCITRSTPATPKAPPPPPRHRDKKPITPATPPPPPRSRDKENAGEAIGMKAPRWISVTDRLPDVDQRVLVSLVSELDGHRMKRPELGYTTDPAGKMWFITTWKEWAIDSDLTVTHWMPLPEPPEEVSGDADGA